MDADSHGRHLPSPQLWRSWVLNKIPGPKSKSLFWGQFWLIREREPHVSYPALPGLESRNSVDQATAALYKWRPSGKTGELLSDVAPFPHVCQ